MSEILYLADHPRFKQEREAPLSKKQLSEVIGFSTKWIEQRMKHDGLPFHRKRNGYAQYWLSEVNPWLHEWLDRRSA
jgi:biotin operon repressor